MYTIKTGGETFKIQIKRGEVELNGKPVSLDLENLGNNRHHLIIDRRSYNVEVINYDKKTRKAKVKVNNEPIEVEVATDMDMLLADMGLNNHQNQAARDVGAPMPGLILDIVVKEGDEVKKGDKLLILEAMKMENVIKSPGDGKIKTITVQKGQSVESGQKLILFE